MPKCASFDCKPDEHACSGCPDGWWGKLCEIPSCHLGELHDCKNGGKCKLKKRVFEDKPSLFEDNRYYYCECKTGWSGITCEVNAMHGKI